MRRVGRNSFTEIYFAGCNPELCRDQRRLCDDRLAAAADRRGALARADGGEGADPLPDQHRAAWRPHLGQRLFPQRARWSARSSCRNASSAISTRSASLEEKRERFKQTDPDSVWLVGHPDYPASNPPTADLHRRADPPCRQPHLQHHPHPGHTAPQTSVHVPEEGVVFTGDNVFHKCRSLAAGMRPVGVAGGARRASTRSMSRRSCPATASPAARPI